MVTEYMEIVNVVNISQLLTQSETVHLFAFAKRLYSLVCNEPNSVQQYTFLVSLLTEATSSRTSFYWLSFSSSTRKCLS